MTYPIGSLVGFIDIQGAAAADASVRGVQRSLDLTGESAASAGVQFDRTGRAMLGTADASSRVTSSASKYRAAQLQQIASQERYNSLLESSTASTRQLASAEASLVRANERVRTTQPAAAGTGSWWGQAAKGADEAAVATGRFASSARGAVATAGQLGLMVGGFELVKKAIDIGKQAVAYQADMTRIRSLTGASAAEIGSMESALLKMAGPLATAPEQLATSLYHVESIGLRGAKALDAVTVAAKGAQIGNADLEETTNALTSTIQSGIAKNQSYSRTMSELLTIVGTGDMKLSDFNESLSSGLLSIVALYGVKLPEVGAALATFGDNNVRGANAATFLRTAVQSLAVVAPTGQAKLKALGIDANQLRDDLERGGLTKALGDLKAHLDAAHVTGSKVGATLTSIFTKRAGPGLSELIGNFDLFHQKLDMIDKGALTFAQRWQSVSSTAGFALKQFSAEADAVGITLAEKATPAVTTLAHLLAAALPAGLAVAQGALHPFSVGWHDLSDVLGPVGHALGDVGSFLGPLAPLLGGTAEAVLAMWLAFKGYQVAVYAVDLIRTSAASMGMTARNSFATAQKAMAGTASEARVTSAIMQAEFAQISAAALADAAALERATAIKAVAFADQVAASKAATDAEVTAAAESATASLAQAKAAQEAAAVSAAAAETAAAEIDAAGKTARFGWSSLAGPIGLAALGVFTVVSAFHKSSAASKEATDAAKAYTDALKGDGPQSATIIDTIVKQLSANNVPQKIAAVNAALGSSTLSGKEFITAIQTGGPALDTLRSKLERLSHGAVIFNSLTGAVEGYRKQFSPLTALLADLNSQYVALSKATLKDLQDTKAFAGASASIDKVAASTHVASNTARQYATMAGIVVDQQGVAAVSARELGTAVGVVSKAYDNATVTGQGFLTALDTFSKSSATAADRAALIGATLKAGNGDALAFVGAMAGASQAVYSLDDAFKQQREELAQQSNDQAKAITRVHDAQARLNEVRSNSKSTANQLRAAERSLTSAQEAAGKAGALAYADTERAAIHFRHTQDGLRASIDSNAKGAGDLVSQLQAMQTAAMAAAAAEYEHEKSIESGKKAADDAYNVYRTKTYGALVDNAKQLGLNHKQAKALSDAYFGMPKNIKTKIESEGTSPMLTVLRQIRNILAELTGHPWNVQVNRVTPAPGRPGATGGGAGARFASGGEVGGDGPKGVDSEWIYAAPGEWVVPNGPSQKYRGFLEAITRGGVAAPAGVRTQAAQSTAQKHVHLHGDLNLVAHYPEPDKDTTALPRLVRQSAEQLGSFL